MNAFHTVDGELHCEGVPVAALAERFGTPLYVYSRNAIRGAWRAFADAAEAFRTSAPSREMLRTLVTYAVKANGNLAILADLAREGAGFDIVSGGELARALAAGARADRIVFSGVGKQAAEIRQALEAGVKCFNVESEAELERIEQVAAQMEADSGRPVRAPVSLRVNPDVDAGTHPYISTGLKENKFGIAHERAVDVYRRAAVLPHLRVAGIDCHIGSQITTLSPFLAALDKVLELVDALAAEGIDLEHIDLGGGLGVSYGQQEPPSREAFIQALYTRIDGWRAARGRSGRPLEIVFEFGRSIVAEAGALVTRVEYIKQNGTKHFAVIDAAMNDLMRPALYESHHPVAAVRPRVDGPVRRYDLVGPVCETGDWLARDRDLSLEQGDLLALLFAGAYGSSMSSNYNARPRVAEVMVDGTRVELIRQRERLEDLWRDERIIGD